MFGYSSSSYILDILEGGRKLIVFAHHKAVLDAISECLSGKVYMYNFVIQLINAPVGLANRYLPFSTAP